MSIVVQDVTKHYGSQKALDNVSFAVKTGEIVAFLGPNGAGKSTMMKIITGFIPASSGSVMINGTEVSSDDPEIKKKIGYLPENNPLYPEMYVREYLGFVASIYKQGKSARGNIDNVIELTGLGPESKKKIGALSKGYRQRVGLAQALINDPDVLILDEATSSVDAYTEAIIQEALQKLLANRTSIIIAHRLSTVVNADRIIVLDHGKIVEEGTHNSLLADGGKYAHLYKQYFEYQSIH